MTNERPTRQCHADIRPFFVKPIQQGTGVRLSLKLVMKSIEEGKVINDLIIISFLQSELKGKVYCHTWPRGETRRASLVGIILDNTPTTPYQPLPPPTIEP